MKTKIKKQIEQKYPHLKVLDVSKTKHGTPIAIVQIVDKTNPCFGLFAIMYIHPITKRLTVGIRSTNLNIIRTAFKEGKIE